MRAVPIAERFWTKVSKQGPWCDTLKSNCWQWLAGKSSHGYGYITESKGGIKRHFSAHRLAFEWNVGAIDSDKQIDHLCRNRACVNPTHLEQVTIKENLHRSPIAPAALNSRKLCCHKGHSLLDVNVYINSKGSRICKTCSREKALSYYYKKRRLTHSG